MFGAEGVGWRGLGRDAAPAVVVAAAAATTTTATETAAAAALWGAFLRPRRPVALPPLRPARRRWGGGCLLLPRVLAFGGGSVEGQGPFGGLKEGTSARECWRARFRSGRGLAFLVAEPRTEDGSGWGSPVRLQRRSWLVTEAAGLGPPVILLSGGPGPGCFPRKEGLGRPPRIPFPLAPGTGETGARPHLSAAWGARGEESWHCSHKTDVM